MPRSTISAAAGALALSCAGTLCALDLDTVELHGFVSQGYLETNRNEFIERSNEGTFSFGEAALTVTANPIDRLRVGAQVFARNFGDSDQNGQLVLDWAYGDYRLHDLVGVRAGKIKFPKGLYNEIQDIDAARTSILLPQSVYGTHLRDFWTSLLGASLYGSTPSSVVGSFDYQVYIGTLNVPDDGTTAAYYGSGEETDVDVGHVSGFQLIWNAPVPGLRLGGSASHFDEMTLRVSPAEPLVMGPFVIPLDHTITLRSLDAYVLSAEYTLGDLRLAGEYSRQELVLDVRFDSPLLAGVTESPHIPGRGRAGPTDTEGWYLGASYRLHPRFELGTYYAHYWADHRSQGDSPKHLFQGDLAISALFEVNPHWLIKAEFHNISGTALLPPAEARSADEDWTLWAIKTTFTF